MEIDLYNDKEQRICSLEIAELSGKMHKDVMKAIRTMEPEWVKVCGRKFALTSKMVQMPNGGVREVPCYSLSKLESLYVITKFNNEARAKLVMRWAELEQANLNRMKREQREHEEQLQLQLKEHDDCIRYYKEVLTSEGTMTVRQLAFLLDMTAQELNKTLCREGVQYGQSGSYIPKAEFARRGFCRSRTYMSHGREGEVQTRHRTTWTETGKEFVVNLIANLRQRMQPKVKVVQLMIDFGE